VRQDEEFAVGQAEGVERVTGGAVRAEDLAGLAEGGIDMTGGREADD
jgi:hypothetical protein